MASTTTILPSIHAIGSRSIPTPQLLSLLDTLFEPSESLHSLGLRILQDEFPGPDYDWLIERIRTLLLSMTEKANQGSRVQLSVLEDVMKSHARLGERKVESVQSVGEQRNLGDEEEREGLRRGNDEYEEKFGGLKFVTFVNGRPRSEIMEEMRVRIERGDLGKEREEAVNAMCDIAKDRARKLGGECDERWVVRDNKWVKMETEQGDEGQEES